VNRAIVLLCTLLAALAASAGAFAQDEATPSFRTVDSIEARVQGCVTCHGNAGQGTKSGYYPRIAGKPAGAIARATKLQPCGAQHG